MIGVPSEEAGAESGPVHVLDATNERELLELSAMPAMSSGP